MKGRFAPSPTGIMHLGNVMCALLSWLSVKSKGGTWVLRIEDLDPDRSRRHFADRLMRDLEWLGLTWDEGPYFQSERHDRYAAALERLCKMDLVYPCFCTRADIMATQAPHESDGRIVYAGTCRARTYNKEDMERAALRLKVPDREIAFTDGHYGPQRVNLSRHCGDFVIRRKDGAWAYQLAVVVDDAEMGITEVVRGSDLLLSSPQQIYLAELLGYPLPSFIHLPLLCNAQGQRLSKRDKSLDMEALRAEYTAEEIIGRLAFLAGLKPDDAPCWPEELLPLFVWNKVPCNDIAVNP
ncbi:MAG: tRNA glutamyl-Q(34) synthetase GluQRS [Bacteroidaceae bacterium]|nr:tRNA glutamyl-Q(34) synthetase GluQRS [Bacteroidaceae bacterium]